MMHELAARPARRRPAVAPPWARPWVLAWMLALLPGVSAASPGLSRLLSGGESRHCVAAGETLSSIAALYGEPLQRVLADNHLDARAPLRPGRCLRIDNRHVVPADAPVEGLLVNLPQRMLFQWRDAALVAAYPVAVGRPDWPTPIGDFHVTLLRRDPVWHVPASIQEEQRRHGETVLREVPSGPDNPLGHYWIGIDIDSYGLHGTNAPASIHGFRTHGCVRLNDRHAGLLFQAAYPGLPVRIVYQTWLLAELPDGSLWLESSPDVYRRGDPAQGMAQLRALARAHGLEQRIDWQRARRVLDRRLGLARRVDIVPAPAAH